METEKMITELPMPEAKRTPCVDGCLYKILDKTNAEGEIVEPEKWVIRQNCDKIFKLADGGRVCIAYESPEKIWRLGQCYLASNKIFTETAKEKMKRKFGKNRF